MLITIKNQHIFGCIIDSDKEPYEALWNFIRHFYPCKLSSEEREEGEWEKILVCKAFGNKLLMNGDESVYSKIGDISITTDIKQDFIPFEGKDLVQWVANKVDEINTQRMYYGNHLRLEEYYGATKKCKSTNYVGIDDNDYYDKVHPNIGRS